MFIKKYWPQIKKILFLFFIWRIVLFFVAYLSEKIIPIFGTRFPYTDRVLKITGLPNWIWGFGNFDGVHYLRIAQSGYFAKFTQAFFPLYPLLIKIFNFFPKDPNLDTRIFTDPSFFYTGFLLSNLFFFFGLLIFYKLLRMDFKKKVVEMAILLLLCFPTSYYFGAVYTESLFFLLIVSGFYFLRKKKYLLSGVFSLLASATRVLGLLMVPVLLIELYLDIKNKKLVIKSKEFVKVILGVFTAPLGAIFYMVYLNQEFANPLLFLTSQPGFGAERSAKPFVLLPQVIFRYFRMMVSIPFSSLTFFNLILEFSFALIPLAVLIILYKKIKLSYFIFTLGVLILPTLTGTFSSMPRYALMSFLLLPYIIETLGAKTKWLIYTFIILFIILTFLFIRGYWVA